MTDNKRSFEDYHADNKTPDLDDAQATKKACVDFESLDWNEASFDEFIEAIDNPDLQALAQMGPPQEPPKSFEQQWDDHFGLSQLNFDDPVEPLPFEEHDLLKRLTPPPGGIGWEDNSAQTGGMTNEEFLAAYALPTTPEPTIDPRGGTLEVDKTPTASNAGTSGHANSHSTFGDWVQLPIRNTQTVQNQQNGMVWRNNAGQGSGWHIQSHGTGDSQSPDTRRNEHGRFDGVAELAGFPASSENLPPGITLDQICWSYPNHLKGANLRLFLQAGWTGRKIWDNMQDTAKVSASKKQPWNKMVRRLQNEKKRMEAEANAKSVATTAMSNLQNNVVNASSASNAERVMQNPIRFNPYITDPSISLRNLRQEEAQGVQQGSDHSLVQDPAPMTNNINARGPLTNNLVDAVPCNNNATDLAPLPDDLGDLVLSAEDAGHLSALSDYMVDLGNFADDTPDLFLDFHLELLKQNTIIFDLLHQQNLEWPVLTKEDQQSRIRAKWLTLASEHEERFAEQNGLATDTLPSDSETEKGMLERLQELLVRAYGYGNVPENDVSAEGLVKLQESLKRMVLENELLIVQGWTQQLELQLEAAVHARSSYVGAEQLFADFDVEEASYSHQRADSQVPTHNYPDLPPTGKMYTQTDLKSILGPQPPIYQPAQIETSEVSRNIGSTNVASSSTPKPTTRVPESRRYGNLLTERTPTGGVGAPRIRMFPSFPDRDIPLTDEDLADLDNILDNYPDHLTLPDVMLRFCRPEGMKSGDYPTKKMVQRLLKHPNAHDVFNPDKQERERALYHWTAAQKARANFVRNRDRKRASAAAAPKAEKQPTNAEQHSYPVRGLEEQASGPPSSPENSSVTDAHAQSTQLEALDDSFFEDFLKWPADINLEGWMAPVYDIGLLLVD